MKGMLKKFVALAATVLFWSSQANAVLIEIVPLTPLSGDSGDLVFIDIVAKDLGGEYITAYDILVAYDQNVLAGPTIDFGCGLGFCDPWGPLSFTGVATGANPSAGLSGGKELSLLFDFEFPLYQDGSDFTLFTMGFTAIADFEALDFAFVWDEFHDVKCTDNEVCFPTAVPEPGTLALLGLGLLGMAVSRRRQKI